MEQDREWNISESDETIDVSLDGREGSERTGSPDEAGAAAPASPGAPASPAGPAESASEPEIIAPEPKTAEEETGPQTTAGEEDEEDIARVQKRMKRSGRKELLDLLHRKNTMLHELDKEVKKTKQELGAKEDRLLRLAAEFENYKKRTRREWELLQKQANADLIKEILGGIDNFDRAFANLGDADKQLQEGIRLIHAGLMDILKKAGVTEIETMNQKFDPIYHEAVGDVESEIEEGRVAQVIQRGYMLHGQIIRPARVLVSRKKG
ncbi:MAG: nucleotide exchange factor GrpE [Candidatus Krumholzibacteria bacterium]|nr:nucleotide exchange factor GrpE [Candidatus Krumholzibacteria bacterium]